MNCQYVKDRIREIAKNIGKIRTIQTSISDPQLNSMLNSYLVVFISGVYEDCIERLFNEKASKSQDPQVRNFVGQIVKNQFRNPNYENIKNFLGNFSQSYEQNLNSLVPQASKTAITSIVNNKNQVAHLGLRSNATLLDLKNWHQKSIVIFQELDRILV